MKDREVPVLVFVRRRFIANDMLVTLHCLILTFYKSNSDVTTRLYSKVAYAFAG